MKWNIITIHKYNLSKTSNKGNRTLWLHVRLGGSSEERKRWRFCLILLQKSRLFCCCTGTTLTSTSLSSRLICRMTCKANWQKKPQHFPISYKLRLAFKRRGCKYWFVSKIPSGKTSAAHHPEVCWRGIFQATVVLHHLFLWLAEAAWEHLALKIADSGISAPRTGAEGLFCAVSHVVAPYSRHSDTLACLSGTRIYY